jgi:hypothetical protein
MDRHQVEGWSVASGEHGTPEQGKGLVRPSAKEFRRHGKEELVNEVERYQGVVETGAPFDHERLNATLCFEGPQGCLEVDGTSGVSRRPHHWREGGKPFDNPLGGRIGQQDQDFLSTLDDKVFLQRHFALVGNNDRERLRHTGLVETKGEPLGT